MGNQHDAVATDNANDHPTDNTNFTCSNDNIVPTSCLIVLSPNRIVNDIIVSTNSNVLPCADQHAVCDAVAREVSMKSMNLYYQNVRGLRTKSKAFYLATAAHDFDIIALTESWLTPAQLTSEYFDSDYIVYRCDRSASTSECGRGGGVLIAISRQYGSGQLFLPGADNVEYVCVKLKLLHHTIYIYCLYVSPSLTRAQRFATFKTHIEAINAINMSPADIIYVLGDFNLPSINWVTDYESNIFLPSNVTSDIELLVIDSLMAMGLTQMNGVTNQNDRILDLIFTNETSNATIIPSRTPLTKIDGFHPPLEILIDFFDFITPAPDPSSRAFNFKKANLPAINEYLRCTNFGMVYHPNAILAM